MFGLLLALFLAAPVMAQDAPEEKREIRNLGTCGLVTRYASSQINDTCLQEALNVYLDEDAGISRRKGFAKYNTTALPDTDPVRGLWSFRANDGTEYLVALTSQSLLSSNGQGSFVQISGLNGLSATQDMDCSQCLGKLWCVNGSDTMFSWDGSSTDTVSTAPTCQAIDCFRNRVVLGNCSGTLSQLRMSGELDGTDYTIPTTAVSTSPVSLSIGGINDGNKLVGIMGVYQDVLVMGKLDSTYGLYGFDRDDFAVREISREVGLVDNRSAREKQGSLYWLSKRGIEKMTGPSITRVSDPVRDLIDTIIVAGGNSRSVTDTTQADFQAGNIIGSGAGATMSATISPFNVVPGSWSIVDSSFDGTKSSCAVVNGALQISTGAPFFNSGFENGDFNRWTNVGWSTSTLGASVSNRSYTAATYPPDGQGAAANISAVVEIYNSGDNSIMWSSTTHAGNFGGMTSNPVLVNVSSQSVEQIYVKAYSGVYSTHVLTSAAFPNWQNGFKYGWTHSCYIPGSDRCTLIFDIEERSDGVAFSSGIFTRDSYTTNFSTPTWGIFGATFTAAINGSTITFQTQSSRNGSSWDSLVSASDTFKILSGQSQQIRYVATFKQSISTQVVVVSSVSLEASTTGYFVGQCRNPGTSISSWGLFQCNLAENDGNITFQVSTGATCNDSIQSTSPWTTQTNNSVVNIATTQYVAYRALFSIDSATQTPTLNDCTINWNEGTSRPSVSAEVYRERYYLAYTSGTSGTVANDHIAVLDSRDQWVLHDAPNCSALGIYNRKLYCGDSGSSGRVYSMDSGHDDDGSAFSSKIKTKDFDMGNTFQKKILKRMYFDMAGIPDQSYSITLTPSYTIDASTDTFSLQDIDLNEDYSRFIAPKVPASLDYNTTGRWFNFGLENSGTQGPWKVFGIRAVFSRLTED